MLITISRMYGSGGSEIADATARALGWELVDNAIVDQIASQLGMPASEVAEREERVPSLGSRILAALSLSTPEAARTTAELPVQRSEEEIVAVTKGIITDAVQRGHTVLVGRGAQCVLGERADVLHVFCYAPRDALAVRVAARLSVSLAEAERIAADTNGQRAQYVMRHWKRDWLAPEHYHLCVNTAWLGIDGATDAIVHLARARFGLDAGALSP